MTDLPTELRQLIVRELGAAVAAAWSRRTEEQQQKNRTPAELGEAVEAGAIRRTEHVDSIK